MPKNTKRPDVTVCDFDRYNPEHMDWLRDQLPYRGMLALKLKRTLATLYAALLVVDTDEPVEAVEAVEAQLRDLAALMVKACVIDEVPA